MGVLPNQVTHLGDTITFKKFYQLPPENNAFFRNFSFTFETHISQSTEYVGSTDEEKAKYLMMLLADVIYEKEKKLFIQI